MSGSNPKEIGRMVAIREMRPRRKSRAEVEKLLESLADEVIDSARKGEVPKFDIPVRALSNVSFNRKKRIIELGSNTTERRLFDLSTARKFMQTVLVADALMSLQREQVTTSLREIYYRTKHTIKGTAENTFDDQDESDPIIEDLEVALSLLREELRVRAKSWGTIIGPITIVDAGDTVDCTRQGIGGKTVPSIVEPGYLDIKRCTADFVLLVEKDTQFSRLSEDKFWKRHNCILLTGNGQAPRGVRRLARRLHEEWRLPIYVLMDNDPWG
jgi:DNA topoisomerase-6 subunit A